MPEPYQPKKITRKRNLPHLQKPDGVYSVTFRLQGSLPKTVIEQLQNEREIAEQELLAKGLSKDELKIELKKFRHLYFGKFDDLLDNSTTGPHFLKNPELAKMVESAILHFDEDRYKVIAYTIMSNHVHLILYKLKMELEEIMKTIKQFSAGQINKYHDCVGRPVWTQESYDSLIHGRSELTDCVTYTLNNSKKVGLVKNWEAYPHSYLRVGFENFVMTE